MLLKNQQWVELRDGEVINRGEGVAVRCVQFDWAGPLFDPARPEGITTGCCE